MKKIKKKNLELRIYEALGIKIFRKLAYGILFIFGLPFLIIMKPKELYKLIHTNPSNYTMKKGNGVQDLKDFKKWLVINSSIHTYSLISCLKTFVEIILLSVGTISFSIVIYYLIPILINCYCIMLQRYNWIRINQTIKKYSHIDEKNKNKIKKEIKNEDALICNHKYKIINKFDKEREVTIDNLLDNFSLKELKKVKELIEEYKELKAEYDDIYYNFYAYGKEYHHKYISNNKSLVLEINHN